MKILQLASNFQETVCNLESTMKQKFSTVFKFVILAIVNFHVKKN